MKKIRVANAFFISMLALALLLLTLSCATRSPLEKAAALSRVTDKALSEVPADDVSALGTLEESSAAAESRVTGRAKSKGASGAASGLRAGYADDNRQFNYFTHFLEKYASNVVHYPIRIEERIHLKVADRLGKAVPNAAIRIYAGKALLSSGKTYSDGSYLFFPSQHDEAFTDYRAEVTYGELSHSLTLARQGQREVDVRLDAQRAIPPRMPLDILFILDTTGSMGEEINRLKKTIEIINLNLVNMPFSPRVRFGMVLYRDRQDQYVSRVIPLTEDIGLFRQQLAQVRAAGGGDGPEDLQAALFDAMNRVGWNDDGLRLAFIITDAPPHLDYGQSYTYVDAAGDAKRSAIKLFSVGTGGLDISGEYILRQISQYTLGSYIFLTYGEAGESEGGRPGSVSHHTGSNFQTDKLETIILGFAREELNNVYGGGPEADEDYFVALGRDDEARHETVQKLFDRAVAQLVDYSSYRLKTATPAALFPVTYGEKHLSLTAEYFGEQLLLSLSRNAAFALVERKDLQAIMDETKFQLSGYVSEEDAVEAGRLTGAEVIITGRLYEKRDDYEFFLKLLRVETGEVMAMTKSLIDRRLGLGR